MAESFTPLTLANINGQVSSAVTSINQNFATISGLLLDVLSLSGVSPNAMQSNLDMNQFNIINLPFATAASEPITLGQAMLLTGTLTLPVSPTFINLAATGTSVFGNTTATWPATYLPGITPSLVSLYAIDNLSSNLYSTAAFVRRSSDTIYTLPNNIITETVLMVADKISVAHNTWCKYTEGVVPAGWTGNLHINEESSLWNLSSTSLAIDPYGNYGTGGTAGATINLRLDSGTGVASNDISAYLQLTNNGGKAINGIVVASNALDIGGGYAGALTMGTSHGIEWYAQAGTRSWRIFTNSAANNTQGQIVLGNGTLDLFLGASNNHVLSCSVNTVTFPDAGSWSTAGIFTTALISPTLTGGSAASSTLTIESTSGVGSSDSIVFKTGSQATCLTLPTTGIASFNNAVIVSSATATPSGGAIAIKTGTTAGFGIYYGSGIPTVSAAQGSLYLRSDGSSGTTRMYVNNSSGSGTTWTAVNTVG